MAKSWISHTDLSTCNVDTLSVLGVGKPVTMDWLFPAFLIIMPLNLIKFNFPTRMWTTASFSESTADVTVWFLISISRLLFYGINKYATTHISDWNFKASLSSDISTFEMDFIFWTNPVFSFVCLDTIIAKPTSAIFELLSVE